MAGDTSDQHGADQDDERRKEPDGSASRPANGHRAGVWLVAFIAVITLGVLVVTLSVLMPPQAGAGSI